MSYNYRGYLTYIISSKLLDEMAQKYVFLKTFSSLLIGALDIKSISVNLEELTTGFV